MNQSTTATLRGFLAIRCASCVPDFDLPGLSPETVFWEVWSFFP